ncbi:hypothetical protein H4R35_002386 [Dimargaris xerosporica]|nr:hypothetical protein H4R35_002386 [Dimargaris xerosporica]
MQNFLTSSTYTIVLVHDGSGGGDQEGFEFVAYEHSHLSFFVLDASESPEAYAEMGSPYTPSIKVHYYGDEIETFYSADQLGGYLSAL